MAMSELTTVLRHLRQVAGGPAARTDGQLLEAFAARTDQAAFEEIVRRHGPMVLGVCRRILGDAHDAEDAFQAAFLVLVRNAPRIRKREAVGCWLHGVACRTAAHARTARARRRAHERKVAAVSVPEPSTSAGWDDLRPVLDEEVNALPQRYRAPVVLCYLEGLTYEEAAARLGCPLGTVAVRLARARDRLRARLAHRGVTLSAGLVAAVLSERVVSAALPAALLRTTVEAAARVGAGNMVSAGLVPARVAALTRGVLESMPMIRWKRIAVIFLLLAVATGGAGVGLGGGAAQQPGAAKTAAQADDRRPQAAAAAERHQKKFARRVWGITEAILKHHLEPCPRDEMLLAGVKALLAAGKTAEPAALDRQVASVQSAEQLAGLLGKLWPAAGETAKLEAALLEGMFARVPGRPALVPPLPPGEAKIAGQISGNRYIGIGIQLAQDPKEKLPRIVTPIRGGPAHKGGMRAGDLILQVDGKDLTGVGLQKAVEWLRGEEGTSLTVVVRQPGGEPRTLKLTRTVVPFEDIFGFRRAGDGWTFRVATDGKASPVGYLAVRAIRSSTLHELRKLEPKLRAEGARALVLDFRFAGGGSLRHVALVADGLLDGGLMWRTRDGRGGVQEFTADRDCLFRDWPVVALVDGTNERGLSVLLAALQDNGRAVLVGEPTKADGYGLSAVPLPDGQGLLTVRSFRIERPDQKRGWPVRPDHEVRLNEGQRKAVLEWIRNKELAELPAGVTDAPPEDPQLRRAVALLERELAAKDPGAKRP
jgi:C-terminal peptidase prc